MKESFVFYRSFFDAICKLDDKKRLKMYDLIANFALNCEEIDPKFEICEQLFILIKPQLIASHKHYDDGKKGGRPKKIKNPPFEKIKTNENDNDNENENVNVNENVEVFEKEKKIDKFSNPIFDDFLKAYKKAFNQNGFLSNAQRDKVIELYETIPDLKERLPDIMQSLKELKFENIDFKPNLAWILKNDNFYSVAMGEYDKQDDFSDFLSEYRKEKENALIT